MCTVPYHPMMSWYPFMGFWMSLIWIIILAALAYLIYRLAKGEKVFTPRKSAEDLLAERYAKGELTREQYLQMKDDIKRAG
jgi:putative membrane protein